MNRTARNSWNPVIGAGRVASLLRFVLALAWFELAKRLATTSAHGLSPHLGGEDLVGLLRGALLLFLLLAGYGYMGLAFDRQPKPLRAMGLGRRDGWGREFGLGAALGWGTVVAVVATLALAASIRISFWTEPRAFWLCAIDLATLALISLAAEVAYRGYAFQRLIEAVGPTLATLLMVCFFAAAEMAHPESSNISVFIVAMMSLLFSLAYLRTRALWLPWGLHFAWKVSMGVMFGLPLRGVLNYATVVQGRALGARWLTGGSYGPEGSAVTAVVLLGGIVVLVRLTRDFAWRNAQPVLVAGGIAVDIAPPAAHVAMQTSTTAAASATLVQIAPPPAPAPLPTKPSE